MVGVLVLTQTGEIQSILVVRLSSIGDIVLTTPLLEELRQAFPQARIDYCTKAPFEPLLASNPVLSSVFTPESIGSRHYDLVVDLQNNTRSRALVQGLNAGDVRRYRKKNWKKLLLVRLKMNLYGDGYRSVVDRYRGALDGIVPSVEAPCRIFPSAADHDFAVSAIGGVQPVLAICFGANHFTKRYPAESFAAVISAVLASMPVRIILLGGKEDIAEGEKIMAGLTESDREQVRSMAGAATLMQSAALLAASDLVLTNDTGLMHMASAFGKKIFLLFGSSVGEFGFLPWRTPYELFETEGLDCRPCSHIGRSSCPEGHFRCMRQISAQRVAAGIVETLKQAAR
ncbi:MAG: glycosyltransferase family 9 protein [Chlorobiaceae bacterium]|nr:glycosyltransferase family 9 protein [Chlorobiaceae bacterium]